MTKIILILLLLFLFYQDLSYRAVYWFLFPLIFIFIIVIARQQISIAEIADQSIYNLSFLFLQLMILSLYFSLKNKKLVNITRDSIGWGDVLFLLVIAFYFSPLNYILFYTSSLVLVLLLSLGSAVWKKNKPVKIPLAGLQALFFLVAVVFDWNNNSLNLHDDMLMISLMNAWIH